MDREVRENVRENMVASEPDMLESRTAGGLDDKLTFRNPNALSVCDPDMLSLCRENFASGGRAPSDWNRNLLSTHSADAHIDTSSPNEVDIKESGAASCFGKKQSPVREQDNDKKEIP